MRQGQSKICLMSWPDFLSLCLSDRVHHFLSTIFIVVYADVDVDWSNMKRESNATRTE